MSVEERVEELLAVTSSKIPYNPEDYKVTASGNMFNKKAHYYGLKFIQVKGKSVIQSDVIIRGDLCAVKVGRFCFVDEGTVVRPSQKQFENRGFAFIPMTIGDNVVMGKRCVIEAASIGSFVIISDDVVIAKRCILKDCCIILPGTVLAPDTVVAPMSVFGGSPGCLVFELPESAPQRMMDATKSVYRNFVTSEQLS